MFRSQSVVKCSCAKCERGLSQIIFIVWNQSRSYTKSIFLDLSNLMLCYAVTVTGIFSWFHFSIWNNTNANLWCQLNNSIFTSDIFALVSCRSWTLCIWCQRILSVPFNRSIVSFENWFKELPNFFSIDIELCTLLVVVLVARERNYHIMKKREFLLFNI